MPRGTGGDVTGGNGGETTGGNGGYLTGGACGGGTGSNTAGGTGGSTAGGTDRDHTGGTASDITGGTGGDIASGTGGDTGSDNTGGAGGLTDITGPCDIYAADSAPCVAAYSMVRRLSSTYDGPLYQVRSDSHLENEGYGGTTHDIGQTADGFADKAAQEAICSGTICTVSLLYDQSGHGNDLQSARRAYDLVSAPTKASSLLRMPARSRSLVMTSIRSTWMHIKGTGLPPTLSATACRSTRSRRGFTCSQMVRTTVQRTAGASAM